MKRFCDICGWETPGNAIYIAWKGKRTNIGFMCMVCGKVHTRHFPTLMLLRDDALMIKNKSRKLIDYQPVTTKKLTTSQAEI